jgi:hypothetical protein
MTHRKLGASGKSPNTCLSFGVQVLSSLSLLKINLFPTQQRDGKSSGDYFLKSNINLLMNIEDPLKTAVQKSHLFLYLSQQDNQ